MTPGYTPLTGLVLAVENADIKFNFGAGEEWVPRVVIRGLPFAVGLCDTWEILTSYAIRHRMVS